MTKVVSLLNMKGGVGKTTLTYNLAWYLGEVKNYRILVVDLDPQSNLTQLMLGEEGYARFLEENRKSIVDIFETRPKRNMNLGCIRFVEQWISGGSLHLIPSRLELTITLKNPIAKQYRLARYLSDIKNEYDIILVDCPPTDSILTVAAYTASDYVLVPVKLEHLATIGLPLLARSIKDFNEEEYQGDKQVKVAGILFNSIDTTNPVETRLSKEDIVEFSNQYDWYVFENAVRNSKAYLNSSRRGTPIFRTSRTQGHIMEEFYGVGDEFLRVVGIE